MAINHASNTSTKSVMGFCYYCYFKAFHKYGAENVNAITPLSVIITFSLWLLILQKVLFLKQVKRRHLKFMVVLVIQLLFFFLLLLVCLFDRLF